MELYSCIYAYVYVCAYTICGRAFCKYAVFCLFEGPELTEINISRARLKTLEGRMKLLQEFRCKVLSRPEAALLRNLRNVKSSKIKKSKLAPKWWTLGHDVKLLLGKAPLCSQKYQT